MHRRDFLKAVAATATLPVSAQHGKRPNFLIILSDDQGYHDVSSYGSEIPTPHMDAIGKAGVKFEQFYAASPVCTPSRFGLLTGRYPARSQDQMLNALMPPSKKGLHADETTFAEVLKRSGYETALIGKWHLGGSRPEFLPNHHGFDHFEGFLHGCVDYFNFTYGGQPTLFRDEKPYQPPKGYSTNYLTDQAIGYLRQKHDKPFLLYLPYNAPHYGKAGWDPKIGKGDNILQAPEEYIRKFTHIADEKRRTYAAMVACLDDNIGRVMQALRESFLEEDTFVIFFSDNGGATEFGGANTPLRGQKSDLFEGGIRVPCFMQWKGRLQPGRDIKQPIAATDIFPTLCSLASTMPPTNLDGKDLTPLLFRNVASEREFFWRTERGDAYLLGEWKYIRMKSGEEFLFDLAADPNETANRTGDAATLARMKREYERVRKTMPA
jgi:arylsulfatase A-like enzyme